MSWLLFLGRNQEGRDVLDTVWCSVDALSQDQHTSPSCEKCCLLLAYTERLSRHCPQLQVATLPSRSFCLGTDCIQWLVFRQNKCTCPLLQFGTVINPSFRAPPRDCCNLCCNLQLLGNLSFLLASSCSSQMFLRVLPNNLHTNFLDSLYLGIPSLQQWAIHY